MNFFLIGAMKSGTTSLYHHLAAHPDIFGCPIKEPKFFVKPAPTEVEWAEYRGLFAGRETQKWAFEATVAYTKYPRYRGVPERIHAAFPDARLIYSLRNPIERTASMYLHNVTGGREKRPFREAIDSDPTRYIDPSRYWYQLSQYLPLFPRERIHVVIFEEFLKQPLSAVREIYRFLEVDDTFEPETLGRRFNETGKKTMVHPRLRRVELAPGYMRIPYRLRKLARDTFRAQPPKNKDILTGEVSEHIRDRVLPDYELLKEFLGREIPSWKLEPASQTN